jgi:hypothetical protein
MFTVCVSCPSVIRLKLVLKSVFVIKINTLGVENFFYVAVPGAFTVCVACPWADAGEFTLSSDYNILFGQYF